MRRLRQLIQKSAKVALKRPFYTFMIVIVIISIIYSTLLITQLKKDSDRINVQFTLYYSDLIERSLKGTQDLSTLLLYTDAAKRMSNYSQSEVNTPSALNVGYDIVLLIRNYIETYNILEDIYLYYPECDLVIGRKGVFNSYVYFRAEHPEIIPSEQMFSRWKSQFDQKPHGFYVDIDDNGQTSTYHFLESISKAQSGKRIVVAKIGNTQMNDLLKDITESSSYIYAALVDQNGRVYAQAGDGTPFLNKDGVFNYRKNSGNFSFYTAKTEEWPLELVTVQNLSTAYSRVHKFIRIIIMGITAVALVSYVLSYIFAKRSQAKIDKLASRFNQSERVKDLNDFDYISIEIDKLIQSNADIIEAAEQQQQLIHSFFLRDLLSCGRSPESNIDHLCATYQVNFEYTWFAIIILDPKQPESDKTVSALNRAIASYNALDFTTLWCSIEDKKVFLCNYETLSQTLLTPVINLAKELSNVLPCEVEISPAKDSLSSLLNFYNEKNNGHNQETVPPAHLSHSTASILEQFNAAVDSDDFETAIIVLSRLEKFFSTTKNEHLIECHKYVLLIKLYEAYDVPQVQQQLENLYSCIDEDDWLSRLSALLQELDRVINRQIDTRHVAEMAKDIFHSEYSNPQLSLQSVADRLCVSSSYLSRLFKKTYNISPISYLNRFRVEKAKELMILQNDNLDIIALQCGFTSNVQLIRVFKKLENQTPGAFRNQK